MSSVDSRIVTMKFDNAAFQKGVSTTMSSLDKLKTSLTGITSGTASKAFSGISTAANHMNLNNVSQQVAGVGAGFTAMATIAVTALATITHKAVEAGLNFAKSFTFGPIMDGLKEYELNLQSIQTIQANTDKPLPVIQAALSELNRYSDKTIYNFGQMAKNIGTFTAAGVDLKTATSSIKGIANMAALSGSTSQQAATAMYQLSQAISSGRVGLQDWNSVVNAGMGGKKLQTALATTATAMGDLNKNAVTFSGSMKQLKINGSSFRNSISAAPGEVAWLNSEVLVNTLATLDGRFSRTALSMDKTAEGLRKFTKEEITAKIHASRLALEQKNGVKYTNEQFKSLMKLSDSSFLAATQVKTLGQVFAVAKETIGSGWSASFTNILGNFGEAKKTFTELSGVVNDAINANALARNKILHAWNKKGGRTALIDGIKNAFIALGHVLGPIHDAFRDIFPAMTGKSLYDLTVRFRDFTESLIAGEGTMGAIRSIFKAIFGVLGIGWEILKGVVHYFTSLIGLLSGGAGGFLNLSGSIAEIVGGLAEWILKGDFIKKFFDKIIAGRAAVFGPIIDAIGRVVSALAGLVTSGAEKAFEWFKTIQPYILMASDTIASLIDKMRDLASNQAGKAIEKFQGYLTQLKPYIDKVRDSLKDAGESIKNFFGGFDYSGLLGSFTNIMESGFDKFIALLVIGFKTLGPIFSDLGGSIKSLFGLMGESLKSAREGVGGVGDALKSTSGVADHAKSAWDGVVEAFKAVGTFLAPVWEGLKAVFGNLASKLKNFLGDMGIEDALALVNTGFFIAFYYMATKFARKLGNVADSMSDVLDQVKSNLKSMQSEVRSDVILKIAAALLLLSVAVLILSRIPADKLAIGLGGIAVMLLMLVKAMKSLEAMSTKVDIKGAAKMVLISAALVGMSLAILTMAAAVALLGNMDTGTIAKGLIAVGSILAVIVAATAILGKTGGGAAILAAAAAILILSVGLTTFAAVLKLFASLDTDMMLEGGYKIAATLAGIALMMTMMPPNMLASSAALFILANALVIVAGAMKIFGSMDPGEMAKSLIMLSLSLQILAAAMGLMQGGMRGAAAMFIMAAALALLTPSLLAFGMMDLSAIGKALLMLAGVFVILGVAALAAPAIALLGAAVLLLGVGALAAGAGLLLMSMGLAALAVSGLAGAAALVGAVILIAEAFPLIMQQFGLGMIAFAKVLATAGPPMVAALTTVFLAMLQAAINILPKLVETLGKLIVAILKVLVDNVPKLVAAGFKLLMGILNGIKNNISRVMKVAADIIVKFLLGIANNLPRIIRAGTRLIVNFLDGIAEAIPKIAHSAAKVIKAFIKALGDELPEIVDEGFKTVIKFLNGIAKGIDENGDELAEAGLNIAEALVDGLVDGFVSLGGKVKDAAIKLAGKLPGWMKKVLGIESPSKVTRELGGYVGKGLALGLDDSHKGVEKSSGGLANKAIDTMKKSMSGLSGALSGDADMTPVIAPVLDLTNVKKGAGQLDGLLTTRPMTVDSTYSKAKDVSGSYNENKATLLGDSAQMRRELQSLNIAAAKAGTKDTNEPRPVVFNIANVADGQALLARARATNKMLTLAEGGDSLQIARIA